MSSQRIISRAEGGIVPLSHTGARVTRPSMWLLLHHTGATGWPKAGWSDAKHMAALQSFSSGAGKTWEYNYVITHPEGWIWEQAGEFQSAHCLNANSFAYGVQVNQADSAGHPPQGIVDSFRWLRAHLVETGQLHPNHQLVPHYGLRSTSCSANDLSGPPQGGRPNSPTGQGSLGSVHPAFAVPWDQPPPPPPIFPGDDHMAAPYLLWIDPRTGAVWQVDSAQQTKRWLKSTPEVDWCKALLAVQGFAGAATVQSVNDSIKQDWLDRIPAVSGSELPFGGVQP